MKRLASSTPASSLRWLAPMGLILAGLLVLFPWQTRDEPPPRLPVQPVSSTSAADLPQLEFVPITQIKIGDRVPGENPVEPWDGVYGQEVDPPTWRRITLRAPKSDGEFADVVFLRPRWWLDQNAARVGGTVTISVPECGIDGQAQVLAIDPCPAIQSGPGQVVTGTYCHSSADVIDLHIQGLQEPIGVTRNHRFWSDDRQAFIPAGMLQPGELLGGLEGQRQVVAARPRAGSEPVYNLETLGAHVYCVSTSGLLVHNVPVPCEEAKKLYLELRKTMSKEDAKKLVYERFGKPKDSELPLQEHQSYCQILWMSGYQAAAVWGLRPSMN